MPKLCAFDFRVKTRISYCACCLIRYAEASCRRRFPRMTSIQGQSGQEENKICFWFQTKSVFGFRLTAVENIDFVTQNLASNRIFGDDFVDFLGKVHLPINTRVKKIVI